MVQFLSIYFFFLDFFNFCWGFQKFPFFLCHSVFEVADTTGVGWSGETRVLSAAEGLEISQCIGQ